MSCGVDRNTRNFFKNQNNKTEALTKMKKALGGLIRKVDKWIQLRTLSAWQPLLKAMELRTKKNPLEVNSQEQ